MPVVQDEKTAFGDKQLATSSPKATINQNGLGAYYAFLGSPLSRDGESLPLIVDFGTLAYAKELHKRWGYFEDSARYRRSKALPAKKCSTGDTKFKAY